MSENRRISPVRVVQSPDGFLRIATSLCNSTTMFDVQEKGSVRPVAMGESLSYKRR